MRRIARRAGSSFYTAFLTLPRERRDAILTIYAWCRRADDIVDGPDAGADRKLALDAFRADLDRAFDPRGGPIAEPAAAALRPVLRRFPIERRLFDELIEGVAMDLTTPTYETWEELRGYAYRVASVVGLMSIEVFGYSDPRARDYAVELGLALQLTNILRDIGPDAARGRIYLPLEDLRREGVDPADVLRGRDSEGLRRAAAATGRRARERFARARDAFPERDRRTLFPAEVMGAVYRRLLDRIEESGYAPFGPRPRVPGPVRLGLALRERLRAALA